MLLKLILVFFLLIIRDSFGENRVAIAYLRSENVTGSIVFAETTNGVHVSGNITGMSEGKYGFHVHEMGDISSCDAAGGHFNPDDKRHGGPGHSERHVGDLGNVQFVSNGTSKATVDLVDNVISLRGRNNILGRALVLHEREDDLGKGSNNTSFVNGNAGARVACAVIGVLSPAAPWNSADLMSPSFLLASLTFIICHVLP